MQGNKINLVWGKVSGATGYYVYVQYCGSKFSTKPTKAVKGGKTNKVTVTKINGKKLNLKKKVNSGRGTESDIITEIIKISIPVFF